MKSNHLNSPASEPGFGTSGLRLFLDCADTGQWRSWLKSGLFYGITTNPILLQRAGVPCTLKELEILAGQAFELGIDEIQLQTWGDDASQMYANAHALAAINWHQVVIKVPVTRQGTEVARQLIDDGIRVTLTGVYAVHQVLTAAALATDYAAPYLGRINNAGRDGYQDVIDMQRVLDGVSSSVRLLVASIRRIEDITLLAAQGVDTFTFSEKIACQWFAVADTDKAAKDFESAAHWQ